MRLCFDAPSKNTHITNQTQRQRIKRDCVLSKVKPSRLASVCTLECASPAEQVGFRLIVARVQW